MKADHRAQAPAISVVIPTYNSASFLPETLASVAEQNVPNLELILVDDGSTDDTAERVAGWDPRLVYLRTENWGGPARPRNLGVQRASSPYVAIFDSDDTMIANKLQRSLAFLDAHPEIGLVFTNFMVIDENGEELLTDFLGERYNDFRADLQPTDLPDCYILPAEPAFRHLLFANFIGTSSVVCRRELLLAHGGFDENMKNSDDVDMWRRLAREGHALGFINVVLHRYRRRPGGVTGRGYRRFPAVIYGLRKHLDADLPKAARNMLLDKIAGLEIDLAGAIRRTGDTRQARTVLREMGHGRRSWRWWREWIKTSIYAIRPQ